MKRVFFVTGLLAILAAISAVSIVHTAQNYTRTMDVVRAFRLEPSDLALTGGGNPRSRLIFAL